MLTEKQKYWQQLIDQWQNSGLTQKQFCEQNNLNPKQFYSWKSQLNKKSAAGQLSQRDQSTSGGFQKLAISANPLSPVGDHVALTLRIGMVAMEVSRSCDEALAIHWIQKLSQEALRS